MKAVAGPLMLCYPQLRARCPVTVQRRAICTAVQREALGLETWKRGNAPNQLLPGPLSSRIGEGSDATLSNHGLTLSQACMARTDGEKTELLSGVQQEGTLCLRPSIRPPPSSCGVRDAVMQRRAAAIQFAQQAAKGGFWH